jgi:sulfite reductase (NADPH) flavoprotein alpha-component
LGVLTDDDAPRLADARFSVCSLGDQNYANCLWSVLTRASIGWAPRHERQDCDADSRRSGGSTAHSALGAETTAGALTVASVAAAEAETKTAIRGERPFPARLFTNRRLNDAASARRRHFEIALGDSGLAYKVGDAFGVWPANHPELVHEVLTAGSDLVKKPCRAKMARRSLRLALQTHYEITASRARCSKPARPLATRRSRAASPAARGVAEVPLGPRNH